MQIVLDFTSSTSLAPTGFVTDVEYAAQYLDHLIGNQETVTISVAWDASNSSTLLGSATLENFIPVSLSTIESQLTLAADSLGNMNPTVAAEAATAVSLPSIKDAVGSNDIILSVAQAEALGIGTYQTLDASLEFGTDGQILNFSTSGQAASGQVTFIDVALNELCIALGKFGYSNGNDFSLLDLFRYSSPGILETTSNPILQISPSAYFSLDGGQTTIATFATTSNYSDWQSLSSDIFNVTPPIGVYETLSSTDEQLLEAIGFNVPCFCPGTKIRTPNGDRLIEALSIGDTVTTYFSGTAKIKWIGISPQSHDKIKKNPFSQPVIIDTDALGSGFPTSPLTVSPGHSVYIKGVLVPIWRLINGLSIRQSVENNNILYIHIELDHHDLLLSNGAWTESFLDEVPRWWFKNVSDYNLLYPEYSRPNQPCARQVRDGYELEAIRFFVNSRYPSYQKSSHEISELIAGIDFIGDSQIIGWAYTSSKSEEPVKLLVIMDGEIIARFPANIYRIDLIKKGIGKGCHGFSVRLDRSINISTLIICREEDGMKIPLPNSEGLLISTEK